MTNSSVVDEILQKLSRNKEKWLKGIESTREMLLGNLSLLSEFSAQTFHEKNRAEFILTRYTASGIVDPKTDRMHNCIGICNGRSGLRNIVVCTHIDNQFSMGIDQNITITADRVHGAGVADDNLAIAALMTLPDILKRLNISLDCNIIILGTTRYHGRGDFEGIRTFLRDFPGKIDAVINLTGITLGTLDYFSLSRVRCDIHCETREQEMESSWMRMSESSAILVANEVISSLYSIPLPKKPKTIMNLGMISGGERYSTISREAEVNLEILSENNSLMDTLVEQIADCCTDIGAKHSANVNCDFFGRHDASGLSSAHPLIKTALGVFKLLGHKPRMEYSNSQITVSLAQDIPSITLGLTEGVGGSTNRSFIEIAPITQGILQLVILLSAIDQMGEICNG